VGPDNSRQITPIRRPDKRILAPVHPSRDIFGLGNGLPARDEFVQRWWAAVADVAANLYLREAGGVDNGCDIFAAREGLGGRCLVFCGHGAF